MAQSKEFEVVNLGMSGLTIRAVSTNEIRHYDMNADLKSETYFDMNFHQYGIAKFFEVLKFNKGLVDKYECESFEKVIQLIDQEILVRTNKFQEGERNNGTSI